MQSIISKLVLALAILTCSQAMIAEDNVLWEGHATSSSSSITPTARIPALVMAPDGTLLAFADNRATLDDIGHGKIDIQIRRSVDQGLHWTNPVSMAIGTEQCAYGDPAVVADNGGSGKVLLMCAAGNVIYSQSSKNNKQRVFKFTSNDNGKSWDKGTEMTETIYGLLGSNVVGTFFTSGKITQSKSKKVGAYNRIYSSLVTKQGNFVLYSDDFGESWNSLGGTAAQTGSNADEAHIVELPNEDLLLVSKIGSNGTKRYINVFNYANNQWGTSGQSNNTTATTCNGDIDIVSAYDQSGKPVDVLIQTAPAASGPRKNITFYYKALTKTDSFTNSDFTSGWVAGKVVCSGPSAYSSICALGNGVVAVLYEKAENQSVRSDPNGYNLVYQTYTISDITNGTYVSVPASEAKTIKMAPKGQMVNVSHDVYPFVPATEIPAEGEEFMIVSADGKYGFSYQKSTAIPLSDTPYTRYTDEPNTDGHLYTFTRDKDGYIKSVGRDQWLNRDVWSNTVSLENNKETKWTIAKNGDKFRISFKPAGTYYLYFDGDKIKYSGINSAKDVIILVKASTPEQVTEQEFDKLAPIDIDIRSDEGYGTYYNSADAYMMPTGLTGYFIEDAVRVGTLTPLTRYDAGAVVPAKTPLLLYGSKGTFKATLYEQNADGNELAREWNDKNLNQLEGHRAADGVTTESERSGAFYYYKLTYRSADDHTLGFFWGAEEGAPFAIPNPNTAYLAVSKSEASRMRGFVLPNDPNEETALEAIAIDDLTPATDAIYTIDGTRLRESEQLSAGLYIRNGKKIIIR